MTGEFTRWGGQILQLLARRTVQYKLDSSEGVLPLTRIDGMMRSYTAWRLLAGGALGANNVKLRMPQPNPYRTGGGRRHDRWLGARLAMGCNLAAFLPTSRSSPYTRGSCAGDRYRLSFGAPFYVAADISAYR